MGVSRQEQVVNEFETLLNDSSVKVTFGRTDTKLTTAGLRIEFIPTNIDLVGANQQTGLNVDGYDGYVTTYTANQEYLVNVFGNDYEDTFTLYGDAVNTLSLMVKGSLGAAEIFGASKWYFDPDTSKRGQMISFTFICGLPITGDPLNLTRIESVLTNSEIIS